MENNKMKCSFLRIYNEDEILFFHSTSEYGGHSKIEFLNGGVLVGQKNWEWKEFFPYHCFDFIQLEEKKMKWIDKDIQKIIEKQTKKGNENVKPMAR